MGIQKKQNTLYSLKENALVKAQRSQHTIAVHKGPHRTIANTAFTKHIHCLLPQTQNAREAWSQCHLQMTSFEVFTVPCLLCCLSPVLDVFYHVKRLELEILQDSIGVLINRKFWYYLRMGHFTI